MPGNPSHGAFHQSSNHETFFGGYTNYGYHVSGGGFITNIFNEGQLADQGTINNYSNDQHALKINNFNHYSASNLVRLEEHCSHIASFDSVARFRPPRCSESTRNGIIKIVEEWANSDGDHDVPSGLFWLYGGAGVGKSALAQSLSEKFQERNQLAASFFFFRGDASRNNGEFLIPTLVWQLLNTFEEITPFVEDQIRENRALFKKTYRIQILELLIKPLLALRSRGAPINPPRLIVIDGLDECENPDLQCELLRVIADAIPQIPYPIRFLVTSRPEAHITWIFQHDHALQAIPVHRYNLSSDPDADMDIRRFIEKEFGEIRRVHSVGPYLPQAWPDPSAVTTLVERSSGHFIYASTVIKYIQSPNHRPDDRLEVILRPQRLHGGDDPYAQLDALYALVFDSVESRGQLEKICLVLGILYFQSKGVVPEDITVEDQLMMKAGDLVLLLSPILSLVAVDGGNVRMLHKSLINFLLDSSRGGDLPFDLALVHESAATYILKQKIVQKTCNVDDLLDFAYHCQYAYLSDALKTSLRSLEVPYTKSDMSIVKPFSSQHTFLNEFMHPMAIWHLFRTLNREDFDPTGQLYDHYIARWMSYLHSTDPGPAYQSREAGAVCTRYSTACQKLLQKVGWLKRKLYKLPTRSKPEALVTLDDLKSELDTLLREWKPQNFNLMDVEKGPVRYRVAQEQCVFSAYAKASFSGNTDAFTSSLVTGKYYTHCYDLGIWDSGSFLFLRTYSRHGNTCDRYFFIGNNDVVRDTMKYLMILDKCLFSEFYCKYGIRPDEEDDKVD